MDLIDNIERIHATELGLERIKRNIDVNEPIEWIKSIIEKALIERKGKNYYVHFKDIIITINAYSFTVIIAHRKTS